MNFDLRFHQVEVLLPNGRKLFSVPDLQIPEGRHVLVQGESGKGKTTFLHLIAGLFDPSRGEVILGGKSLATLSDAARSSLRRENIGVIFQKLNLLDHLTVAENISLSLPLGRDAERMSSALQRVNLDGREQERCSVLSLGEQQRVAVARVLAQKPALILADEPTSSLDEKNSGFVLDALKDSARGKTLIVVSHDRRIAHFFDEVIPFEEFCQ
jgi:putative ABC transport system ATP-binding protein